MITKLGHTGLYVFDLEVMRSFYESVIGLTVTDTAPDLGLVFLSSRPDEEHHELVLQQGRTAPVGSKLVHQISWRVDRLEFLCERYEVLVAAAVSITDVVSHGNAIGVYFLDPESNRLELYWPTGRAVPQPFFEPIDLSAGPAEVLARSDELVAARARL